MNLADEWKGQTGSEEAGRGGGSRVQECFFVGRLGIEGELRGRQQVGFSERKWPQQF